MGYRRRGWGWRTTWRSTPHRTDIGPFITFTVAATLGAMFLYAYTQFPALILLSCIALLLYAVIVHVATKPL